MSRTKDEGSSGIEALCALLILSLLAGTAPTAARAAFRRVEAAIESVTECRRVLALDSELRRSAARICAPYWLPGPEVHQSGDTRLLVNWVDGLSGSCAEFSIEGTLLMIKIAGEKRPPLRLPSPGSLSGSIEGLECAIRLRGKPLVIRTRWSGRSLSHDGD